MRRLAAAWGRRSLGAKFAAIILIAGLGIAAVPFSLSRGEVEGQAQARATDKGTLAANLIEEQRQSLAAFARGLAAQLAPAAISPDPAAALSLLERDSAASAAGDVLGVVTPSRSLMVRGGRPMTDSRLAAMLEAGAASQQSLSADRSGAPWIVVRSSSSGADVVVARPLDAATVATIASDIGSSQAPSDLAIASSDRWISGRLGGNPVAPNESLPRDIAALGTGRASVLTIDGHDVGVATIGLGGGFRAVVSTPVSQVTAVLLPGLLLAAMILGAMLFMLLIAEVDLRRPLARLDRAVAGLGEGDFDVMIPVGGDNEIGRLGRSFAAMRLALHETIRSAAARAAVAGELNAAQPLEKALAAVADELRAATAAQAALILVTGNEMSDSFAVANGIDLDIDANGLLHGGGPAGIVFHQLESGATQLCAFGPCIEAEMGLRQLCVAPLRIADRSLGVIGIASRDEFRPAQCDLVASTAEQVTLALERYRFLAVVQRQATIDDLTGLSNHRFLVDHLSQQVALAERMGAPLAILMLDIDHFKRLNDTYGHSAGDDALVAFADALTSSVRRSDLAARYGGEEFVVVMANTGRDEARVVAEKIRAAVATTVVGMNRAGHGIAITVSIGVAAFPDDTTTAADLIKLADQALYAAKRAGRNRVCMADESIITGTPAARSSLRGRRSSADAVAQRRRPPQ